MGTGRSGPRPRCQLHEMRKKKRKERKIDLFYIIITFRAAIGGGRVQQVTVHRLALWINGMQNGALLASTLYIRYIEYSLLHTR